MIQQQQTDINELESANAEQSQEIELLRTKTNNIGPIGSNIIRSDDIYPPNEVNDNDGVLEISTTGFGGFGSPVQRGRNMNDDIIAIPGIDQDSDDDDNGSDQTDEMDYRLLHQQSMDVVNDYKTQIIELQQKLLEEQTKRQELEQEIESINDRNKNDNNKGDAISVPLLINRDNDDVSSFDDELQPFVKDNDKAKNSQVDKDRSQICCSFLFGSC